nr:Gag-Pol polyprotein [Tanacetum cinerariifolium]
SIHVNFDELPQMASDQLSSDPAPECQTMALSHDSLSPAIQHQANVPQADRTVTTSNELDLLFSLMFDELLNGSPKVVSKSSVINQAETYAENDQVADDEFINIFCTPVQDQGETSSRHVDSSNMHTLYQRYPSEHRWTKDHPLEQVTGNPSQSVRTRRQLESDAEMYLEVAFRKSTCFIRDLNGNNLLTGSYGTDLYSITLQNTNSPNPICLMAKVTSSQAWLWHRRLSHLNFDTINLLSKNDIVVGILKLKFVKDHLCSSYELGKTKRKDGDNLDKMKEKGDECIFMGYSTQSRAYRVFNKRTRVIMTFTRSKELDFLFSLMFDELLNGSSNVVSKSSAVSAADAPNQRQHHTTPLNNHTTPVPTYHPLEQVIGNPSQSVRSRRQLESDVEMCMFALTVRRTKPKNIKEAMADSAWIESMQEELHQFDRLDVWELVDRPLCTNVINLKWL